MAYRALTYATNGAPSSVLRLVSLPPLAPPDPGTVNVKFLMSPVNPADVNVIQGSYPVKARTQLMMSRGSGVSSALDTPAWVGGNEGVAQVLAANATPGLSEGDWVIPVRSQLGTWRARANLNAADVVKVPREWGLRRAAASSVNPATALRLVTDHMPSPGTGGWLMQNTANSAVGECVVHTARHMGFGTVNLVRDKAKRVDIDGWGQGTVEDRLKDIGGDAVEVWNYDELKDRDLGGKIKAKNIPLLLNALSGPHTTAMAKLLAPNATMVSYGAMSLQPLSLPTSLHIFKNLVSRGFWMHRWYENCTREEREQVIKMIGEVFTGSANDKMVGIVGREIAIPAHGEEGDEAQKLIEEVFGKEGEEWSGSGKVFMRWEE